MESVSDIKLNFINLITQLSDYQQLRMLYSLVQSELDATPVATSRKNGVDKFELGKVEIQSSVTKEQIFAEQGKSSISFQEVQELMSDEPWELSLDELLVTLD